MIVLNIAIFSAVRWSFLWQRPQQIASRLANDGHNIVYFQYPCVFAPSTLIENYKEKNIFIRRRVSKNLHIANTSFIPFVGKFKFITEKFGLFAFKIHLKRLNFEPDIAIFYSFLYNFLLEPLESMDVKIVYDCIDEFSDFSDVSEPLRVERDLTKRSSLVIATSKALCEKLSKINSNCFYVPNAADFRHFHTATQIKEKPAEIKRLQYPIIGFIGAVYDWVDIDLICKLAEVHPDYSILLVGPIIFGQNKLKRYSNIMMVGTKKYELLPQYLSFMDVCLIPFKINKLTLASNPIKLYEYLAAGKPVVSTALPEVCDNASQVVMISKDDDFIKKVEEAVNETKSENKATILRRINFARNNSWDKRIDTIEKLLMNI